MSKQEKLISADKLQKWIDEMFNKRFPNDVYGYQDGRQSILDLLEQRINDGTFNPDPVPTIKLGDKVKHEEYGEGWVRSEVSERKAWISFHSLDYDMEVPAVDLEVVKDE